MALFQPTNITPSTLGGAGNGTIDVNNALTVSWQVNGNSPLVAYQIKIMQNDTASTLKLDTGKVTLNTPFYGTDYKGDTVFFSVTISSSQMTTAGMENGYANGYKMTIKQWWNANDAVEQTSASYFITRSTPVVSMYNISSASSFYYQEYTFTTSYNQSQGDAIEWSRWELQAKENGAFVTIDDTGYLYGAIAWSSGSTIYLEYYHNGFAVGVDEQNQTIPIEHRIKCTVQTANGVQVDTGWKTFTTNMNSGHIPATLNLCVRRESDSVKIEMPKNFPLLGTASGTYSFVEHNSEKWLTLPYGTNITFGGSGVASLAIDDSTDYSIYFKMSITDTSHTVDYLVADYGTYQMKFGYNSSGFTIKKGSTTIWSLNTAPTANTDFAIALTDTSVLFGINNNGTVTSNSYTINAWKNGATLNSLKINGPGVVRGMHVIGRQITPNIFTPSLNSTYSFWEYTTDMQFYGRFDGTLYTGFIDDSTDSLSIYRKTSGASAFKLIANIPLEQRMFYDYSALNQTTYEYFFMLMAQDGNDRLYVQERHGIASVTPCWWNYTVLCCSEVGENEYVVQSEYRFGLNLESGSVGNNNSPTVQRNFTKYPVRQPISSNYRSGTLTSLIGRVSNDQYTDSVSLMDELYALSTSTLTKFLKTRKGQIFQIETGAPVSMQIADKYAQQPAKISLPWIEVGDASNANILNEIIV